MKSASVMNVSSLHWNLVYLEDKVVVVNKDATDTFTITTQPKDFDSNLFVRENQDLNFKELKELVEFKFNKEKNVAWFANYCICIK